MSVAGCKFTSVYYLSHHNRTFTIKFTKQQVTPSPLYYILSVCLSVCLSTEFTPQGLNGLHPVGNWETAAP